MSVDEYFAARAAIDREIFDCVMVHFSEVGPVLAEAVSVGILFKQTRTFAELRPRRTGFGLSFILSRAIEDARITRTTRVSRTSHRRSYGVNIVRPEDVDDVVRSWLTEAYFDSPG